MITSKLAASVISCQIIWDLLRQSINPFDTGRLMICLDYLKFDLRNMQVPDQAKLIGLRLNSNHGLMSAKSLSF